MTLSDYMRRSLGLTNDGRIELIGALGLWIATIHFYGDEEDVSLEFAEVNVISDAVYELLSEMESEGDAFCTGDGIKLMQFLASNLEAPGAKV